MNLDRKLIDLSVNEQKEFFVMVQEKLTHSPDGLLLGGNLFLITDSTGTYLTKDPLILGEENEVETLRDFIEKVAEMLPMSVNYRFYKKL